MSVEVLQVLTLVFFIISAALGLFAVFLFFALRIPKVLGDLSGVTARKAIEDIQRKSRAESTQGSGYSKNFKGITSDKGNGSERLRKRTDKLEKNAIARSSGRLVMPSNMTAKLKENDINATVLLASQVSNETTVLGQSNFSETTVLAQKTETENVMSSVVDSSLFTVDVDINLCDSVETID